MLQNLRTSGVRLIGICGLSLALSNACSSQSENAVTKSADPQLSSYEELARDKVAAQIDAATVDVSVISSQAVQFNDSSLNCPQPGMLYAQVITDGHQVLVSAREKTYDVRITGDYALICNTPGKPPTAKRRLTR
jgi:hypothetical protein